MKKTILIILFLATLASLFILAEPAFAQIDLTEVSPVKGLTPGTAGVSQVVGQIVLAILGFAGAVLLLMFVYGGLLWLTSSGSPEKITKGKQTITWAVIGFVLMIGSYLLIQLLITALTATRPPQVAVTPTLPPIPPPPQDACSVGACTDVGTGTCGDLIIPQQDGSGSCPVSGSSFKCCSPLPPDTCESSPGGACEEAGTDCAILSTPKKSGPANACESSSLLNPPKTVCCVDFPNPACPDSPDPTSTTYSNLTYYTYPSNREANQTKTCAETVGSTPCCDCGYTTDTQNWSCVAIKNFTNRNDLLISTEWQGAAALNDRIFSNKWKTDHCGTNDGKNPSTNRSTDNVIYCMDPCAKAMWAAIISYYSDRVSAGGTASNCEHNNWASCARQAGLATEDCTITKCSDPAKNINPKNATLKNVLAGAACTSP